jgi:hypothetical protein
VLVPPREYGGTERIVHTLTRELVPRGHDVTLFASAGSQTSATLHSSSPAPLWQAGGDALVWHAIEVEELVKRSREFDVIHSHLDILPWLGGGYPGSQTPAKSPPEGEFAGACAFH